LQIDNFNFGVLPAHLISQEEADMGFQNLDPEMFKQLPQHAIDYACRTIQTD
jgi:hypothetical protein